MNKNLNKIFWCEIMFKLKFIKMSLSFFLLLYIFISCAKIPTTEKILSPKKILVMDMSMPLNITTSNEIQSWWFGSKDIYYSDNAGRLFSDYLANNLVLYKLNIISRTDIAYFLLDKKDEIKKEYPVLTEEEINSYLTKANPIDFGKTFDADIVIAGRIIQCKTIHNRTFHWWKTFAQIEIDVFDIRNEKKLFSHNLKKTKYFWSNAYTLDFISKIAAKDINKRLNF